MKIFNVLVPRAMSKKQRLSRVTFGRTIYIYRMSWEKL